MVLVGGVLLRAMLLNTSYFFWNLYTGKFVVNHFNSHHSIGRQSSEANYFNTGAMYIQLVFCGSRVPMKVQALLMTFVFIRVGPSISVCYRKVLTEVSICVPRAPDLYAHCFGLFII